MTDKPTIPDGLPVDMSQFTLGPRYSAAHEDHPMITMAPPPPADGRNGRWERLGRVGADSASIGITDLLVGTTDSRCRPACDAPADDPWAVRYAAKGSQWAGDWGTGIRFWAGFGDGGYDVWGWIADYGENGEVDERVAQVVITMIDAEGLADWRAMP